MENTSEKIQSVERALVILELLGQEFELGITEISKEIGLGKSTVHRLLATLKDKGFVQQTASGKYRLSLKLFEVGNMMVNKLGVRKEAGSYLEKLASLSGETVNLAVIDKCDVIYIERIESSEPLRMGLEVGRRLPAFCTALGKVILAYLPEHEFKKVLAANQSDSRLPQFTNKSITNVSELYAHLQQVKEQGYSFDDEEFLQGLRCVAAPIFDHMGKVIAAISISGPTVRMTYETVNKLIPYLKEATVNISKQMGYKG
ncbi:Transcriptional regulator KdgR [Sporomusa carbonis]|uniref:IclR family transcriptional regulator n=1 Tax=Sporomusa carbonis TaxID=3076075 RepID=UPI003A63D6E2